jgi:hypothetical protein
MDEKQRCENQRKERKRKPEVEMSLTGSLRVRQAS